MQTDPNAPLVSVIIPTKDRLESCQKAILSVEAQSYLAHETIVVEDGSDSGIQPWLQASHIKALRYLRHEVSQGLAAARNSGLAEASGEFVAFLDDDDSWMPEKLERQVNLGLARPSEKLVVTCGALILGRSGQVVGSNHPRLNGNLRESILRRGLYTVPSSLLLRTPDALGVGGFDEAVRSHVDHDFVLTLAKAGFAAIAVDEDLVRTNLTSGPRMTVDVETRIEALDELFRKWSPDLRDWYGDDFTFAFVRNHYVRVGAQLLSELVLQQQLPNAFRMLSKISADRSDPRLTAALVSRTCERVLSRSPLGSAWRQLRRSRT